MAIFSMQFAAPMMALSGPLIDGTPQAVDIPTRSMITGMLGAALGIGRGETATLQAIQDNMRIAVVVEQPGRQIEDYQTADLSKPFLTGPMWTSGEGIMVRSGSEKTGTRIQKRPYLCDARMTVFVELLDNAPYNAETLIDALDQPQRMLAYGRLSCPPTGRIAGAILDGVASLPDAVSGRAGRSYLPVDIATPEWGDLFASIPGARNWASGKHGGADIFVMRAIGQGQGS